MDRTPARRAVAGLAVATLACTIALSLSACHSTRNSDAGAPGAVRGPSSLPTGRYELVVNGMSCPKCVSNVELQLTRIPGVVRPVVDMKNGKVTIDVEDGNAPSSSAIASAIADSGFTLVEIRGGVD
ncbi:MAG: Heavy-metal-associated domain [Planctomycetota bacterium]|jgi:copper chaperone CopZ